MNTVAWVLKRWDVIEQTVITFCALTVEAWE